jgi:hypothetical protein
MRFLYDVTQEFEATNAISGEVRRFRPGETFVSYAKRNSAESPVTIEADLSFFLVERSIFDLSCTCED